VGDKDRNLLPFMKFNQRIFAEEGLALVVMDCPTDHWTQCNDDYRLSQQHADDVRSVMAKLRQDYGLTKIYIFGHSMGSESSRWLAKNLEIGRAHV
jgi:triacylglycerol esterase/lipase EstA (alpha/beta hydrolase family)